MLLVGENGRFGVRDLPDRMWEIIKMSFMQVAKVLDSALSAMAGLCSFSCKRDSFAAAEVLDLYTTMNIFWREASWVPSTCAC